MDDLLYLPSIIIILFHVIQKQPPRGVLWKRCSENMQQIYRRTIMYVCSPVNLLHIFKTPFPMNTSGRLLLVVVTVEILVPNFWIDFNFFYLKDKVVRKYKLYSYFYSFLDILSIYVAWFQLICSDLAVLYNLFYLLCTL